MPARDAVHFGPLFGPAALMAGAASATIRVIVAEPASSFRSGVSRVLAGDAGILVAAVGSSAGLVRACAFRAPHVALVTLDLPSDGGIATVERLQQVAPSVRIVVWSDEPDDGCAVAAIRAGARGVLQRDIAPPALLRCVKQVAAGQLTLPRHLVGLVLDELQRGPRRSRAELGLAALSEREHQVLRLVSDGHGNEAIGQQLAISESTVKHHVHRLLNKLAVPSRAAAAAIYGSAYSYIDD
jgi:two-component system nitrate/nitrite response regulator NarL